MASHRALDVWTVIALLACATAGFAAIRPPRGASLTEPMAPTVRDNPSSWRPALAARTGYIPVRTASGNVVGGVGYYGSGGYRSGK